MTNEALKPKDMPFIRSQNNYDTKAVSEATALECKDPSLAQQQFAEEADINYIAERYGLGGAMPPAGWAAQAEGIQAMFGDFTGALDFQSAQDLIVNAHRDFMQLPAKLRARFDNSPQKLLEFLEDPENRAEAIRLKLANPPQEPPQSPTAAPAPATGGDGPSQPAKGSEAAPKPPKN